VEDIHTIGEIPIVLVGTFQDSPQREVTSDEAQTAAEALHASYFECSPLLGRGVQELFAHAATVLQTADQIPAPVTPVTYPTSATRNLFNLVRGRRSFSHFASSTHSRSQSHYVPHSASSRQQLQQVPNSASARQQMFGTPTQLIKIPSIINIAPGLDTNPSDVAFIPPEHLKCVILGGDGSGKKSLVHRYLHGTFEWLPEVPWMTWKAAVKVQPTSTMRALDHERRPSLPQPLVIPNGSIPYALSISETGAAKGLDSLRRSTYSGVSAFVICFGVSDYREEVMQEVRERVCLIQYRDSPDSDS
jgi:GTPase SAR1 family protein